MLQPTFAPSTCRSPGRAGGLVGLKSAGGCITELTTLVETVKLSVVATPNTHSCRCSPEMRNGPEVSSALLKRFPAVRAHVVGDLLLDHYLSGQTERISREAPVLIVRHEREVSKLGGGANADRLQNLPPSPHSATMRISSLWLTMAALLAACSGTPLCDASNCLGCCDATGQCVQGGERSACGVGGSLCDVCVAGQTCVLGDCQSAVDAGITDGGAPGACAGTLIDCDGECTDTLSDAVNCGRCERVCGSGEVCNLGRCEALPTDCVSSGRCALGYACDPGTRKCLPGCRLGTECPLGGSCQGGSCQCSAGQHACGQRCVNEATTPACCAEGFHACGGRCVASGPAACGTTCAVCPTVLGTAACVSGRCEYVTCVAGYHRCGGTCVADNSVTQCGATCSQCPTAAGGVARCVSGACRVECPAGQMVCGGSCVDTRTNPAHCGACNVAVPMGASCQGGVPTCPPGAPTVCGGRCVDTQTDSQHCGRCNGGLAFGSCTSGTPTCSSPSTQCGQSCAPAQAPCPLPLMFCLRDPFGTLRLYSTNNGRLASSSTVYGCGCQGGDLVVQGSYSVSTTCYGRCVVTDAGVVTCP